LDVQAISSTARGAQDYFVTTGHDTSVDVFAELVLALISNADLPRVLSISYGADDERINSTVRDLFDYAALHAGMQGITVVVSTGDDGVAANECTYSPSFPATSAWVTAVGATQGAESARAEIAASPATGALITSGSGFAVHEARPWYQKHAVAGYLAATRLPTDLSFHSHKRAVPDVSLAGHNFPVVINNNTYNVDGTSVSTPLFAGFVSLVNGMRLANGLSTLGFINPLLYVMGRNFDTYYNDVTQGASNCRDFTKHCCTRGTLGFLASPGYDVVTGWGSPKFAPWAAYLSTVQRQK